MFKKLIQNRKAQQTAEYALLISLVVAAVIAMQTYVQRGLQARYKEGIVDYLVAETTEFGTNSQYEPYYLEQKSQTERFDDEVVIQRPRTQAERDLAGTEGMAISNTVYELRSEQLRTQRPGAEQIEKAPSDVVE